MIRGMGVRGAVAVNVITMIGIGPLITIPLVLANLHGSLALVAWIVGAGIALCDGLVWAELGSLYPGSGGTYVYLRETFGSQTLGRMLAFLFTWQIVLSAPLLLASGYIGFAHYAGYLWPPLASNTLWQGIVAAGVGILTLALLYRPIGAIAAISSALAGVAIATLAAVIAASITHFNAAQAFSTDHTASLGAALLAGLGPALVITLYDYYGYAQSCTLGDEVHSPARVLPRSVIISVLGVAALYIALQAGVLGVVRWQELVPAHAGAPPPDAAGFVASTVLERVWGTWPARIGTLAILLTAFASTFGNLLGYSRIPYAAARDGVFLKPFASLHRSGRFPYVALLTIGLLALPACFFSLGDVIAALTAGLVVIQNLAQIAVLFALRARGIVAPYRMRLFPLPALLAAAGWAYIFVSAGTWPIAFGLVTLAAGTIVYLWRARVRAQWPFAQAAAALFVVACALAYARPVAAAWSSSAILERHGFPVFTVSGKPFFVYGAAFFYERLPRDRWRPSMEALRGLGINTLDLYVPWNWHELSDGDFDFSGRTSPRRDLREVIRLAREFDFKIILRPGPVIRNEWRNGGYPAWLLERPEYGMPLHDLLEGRYPPTATLQNAHSDDAAAEWLANPTHLRYAKRWLERVLHEFDAASGRVIAVQLDDDQGAYIDNQTWPAPHFQAYLRWLEGVVHDVTGPLEPVFINTYQMKVTASSPVWAMGNWYQSDAYSIGEHDRAQLEFSTGLLQTRPHQPLMLSEFQAGWLEQPDDIRPRPADPSNTLLAQVTLLGMGVRGIVNFPAQDTLYPSGMEAPFANAFYAWDAALGLDGAHSARYGPTAAVGNFVKRYGGNLATAVPAIDAGIAYTTSAYADPPDNAAIEGVAERTIVWQQTCRSLSLSCRLVDLRFADDATLRALPLLIVPQAAAPLSAQPFDVGVTAKLQRYERSGGHVTSLGVGHEDSLLEHALVSAHVRASVRNAPGATLARSYDGAIAAYLFVPNYGDAEVSFHDIRVQIRPGTERRIPELRVAARGAIIMALRSTNVAGDLVRFDGNNKASQQVAGLPVRRDAVLPYDGRKPLWVSPPSTSTATFADCYRDGSNSVVLENALVRIVVAPTAGARAFLFEDKSTHRNIFTTVGALRDDVLLEPSLSTTDRIAKYTHQFPAGMFNRPYRAEILGSGTQAVARFTYDAPDVVPAGAHFTRTVTLAPNTRVFSLDETATFAGDAAAQRVVSVTSLAVGASTGMKSERVLTPDPSAFVAGVTLPISGSNALGYYDTASHELATVAWRPDDVENAHLLERQYSVLVRLVFAPGRDAHIEFGYTTAETLDAARTALTAAGLAAQGRVANFSKASAEGKWRNGLRDRLKSG